MVMEKKRIIKLTSAVSWKAIQACLDLFSTTVVNWESDHYISPWNLYNEFPFNLVIQTTPHNDLDVREHSL